MSIILDVFTEVSVFKVYTEPMSKTMPMYDYQDYRDFLHDWFWTSKAINPKVSFRYMSKHLGLSSPNHFHLVVSKKRHLSPATFLKVVKIVKPSSRERQYLKLLFTKDLETNQAARLELENQLSLLREQNNHADLADQQYLVVSNALAWYIKMGAIVFDQKSQTEIEKIVRESSQFPIAENHVASALKTLTDSGFAVIEDEIYKFDFANVATKWDFDRSEIKNHHANNLKLALQTISWPIDQRFFSSVTIPCDEDTYQMMITEVRNLCLKILDRSNKGVDSSDSCKKVATLQFSLFPFFVFPTDVTSSKT